MCDPLHGQRSKALGGYRPTRQPQLTAFFPPVTKPGHVWCWGLLNGTGHSVSNKVYCIPCETCGKGHCVSCMTISLGCDHNILKCDCNFLK